tara:strand:- start:411 stop:515 length:105 start_codon:yes stop_codon:yes gene_type:complete
VLTDQDTVELYDVMKELARRSTVSGMDVSAVITG